MRRWLVLIVLLAMAAPPAARGDAGVLIPTSMRQPDPKVLSLDEMVIDIRIDNGDARVSIRQIFGSHTGGNLEATYFFALNGRATVSDFAVWDDVTRIPGVILERRRAEEIYENLRWQSIDPGLLQVGEGEPEEARRSTVFSARIVPIPGFGTKRIEIEYHETIPVEELKSFFVIPLKPDAYRGLAAGRLSINFELRSAHALRDFEVASKSYPLAIKEQSANLVRGSYAGTNVAFTEDFAVRYSLDPARSDTLEVITYRNPVPAAPSPADTSAQGAAAVAARAAVGKAPAPAAARPAAPPPTGAEPGFFQAAALIGLSREAGSAGQAGGAGQAGAPQAAAAPRTIVVLFDCSLSMQFEKLERSFQAMETLLRSLGPADEFSLVLFNSEVMPFARTPAPASSALIGKALEFVRSSLLRGGTDLGRALEAGLAQAAAGKGEPYLVLLGDGSATRGTISNAKLAAWYEKAWKQMAVARQPRTYALAVGDDANTWLLRALARNNGVVEWVRSTEPLEFKLNAFIGKIGRSPVEGLKIEAAPTSNFDLVYPLENTWFAGALASWVGQYKQPLARASFDAQGLRNGRPFRAQASAALPAQDLEHPQLPRTWAQLRVNALLEKIEREGEDRASVDEIIRLARKYKFITPYTSFLAAPRSLLRPRVIRPGDPVLRVRTDPAIVSVVALFPFGLIKPLRYLGGEDIWQTRFLAPREMNDGTYWVRLILRDRAGHVYREQKSFVIASRPPIVRVKLDRKQFRRGETVYLRASASETTRTITARMPGVPAVRLTWNQKAGSNTGELWLPPHLPAGTYVITVTAEDIAHNIGSQEVSLEVLP